MKTLFLSSAIVLFLSDATLQGPIRVSAKGGGGHGSGSGSRGSSNSHTGSSSSKGSSGSSSSSSGSSAKSGSGSGSSGSSSSSSSGIIIIHDTHDPSICYNQATMQQVPCPKQQTKAGTIAGIVLGSVFGALILGLLIRYLFKKYRPRYREWRARRNVLPITAPPAAVSSSDGRYQALDGHRSPEGISQPDDTVSFSDTSTFVGHEETSQKKIMGMPDPEKGYQSYVDPYERK